MARLRLFAHLRELAGTDRLDVDGETVGDVLDAASASLGEEFARGLGTARVWVNGEPAESATAVGASDEVAVLPPVSGGEQAVVPGVSIPWSAVAGALLAGLLFLDPAFFVAGAVGVLGAWAWDLARSSPAGPDGLRLPPVLVAIAAGIVAPALLIPPVDHLTGVGVAAAVAVIASFGQAVVDRKSRSVVGLGTTMLVSVVAATAAASAFLVRLADGGISALWVLLAASAVASLAATAADRIPALGVIDPLSAGAIGTVATGLVVALVLDLSIVPYLLVSMVLALALIGGRALGSLVRTGRVLLVDTAPGDLTALDGAVLATAFLLPALLLFV